ncbi:MAG: hypothetical protein WDA22_08385 [Bacteroidota bacterium]
MTVSLSSGYVIQDGRMYLRFYLTVKNNLDETLDGVNAIKGTIQVQWIPKANDDGNFSKIKTFTIGQSDIFRGLSLLNTLNGKLRIPPNDSIVFYVNWDLKTDDGTFLTNRMPSFVDNQCNIIQMNGYPGKRRISGREKFLFSANIRLYDQLSVLYMQPVTTTQCIVGPYSWIDPSCRDLNLVNPCSVIGK